MSGKSTQKKSTTRVNKRWIFICAICLLFVLNYRASFDRKLDPNGDNISYFLLAKALSEGQGYVDITPPVPTPHVHFPPGYPMFMSVFMRVFPDNIIAMKILNGLLFLIAVLLLFRIIRKTTGDNQWLAFAVCLVTVSHSSLLRWSVTMMSEMLYIVISFGIILICLDLDVGKIFTKGKKDWWQVARLALLCLLVISAYLVRTMGVSVILAAALAFGVTAMKSLVGKRKGWIKPASVATAVILSLIVAHAGWSVRNNKVTPGYKSDYSSGFIFTESRERMTPKLWVERLESNVSEYVSFWIPNSLLAPKQVIDHNKHEKPTAGGLALGAVVILLMAFGISVLKKGRTLILAYLLITFAVLALYQEQYAGVRYFIPVLPLMVFVALNGIWAAFAAIADKLFHSQKALVPALAVFILVAALYPSYKKGQDVYNNVASYKTYIDMDPKSDFSHFLKAADWVKDNTAKNSVIMCRKPEMMYMYSGYRHSLRFPLRGEEAEVLDFMKNAGADYLVVDTWAKHAYTVLYPAMRLVPEAFPIYFKTPQDNSPAPTLVTAIIPSKIK